MCYNITKFVQYSEENWKILINKFEIGWKLVQCLREQNSF